MAPLYRTTAYPCTGQEGLAAGCASLAHTAETPRSTC